MIFICTSMLCSSLAIPVRLYIFSSIYVIWSVVVKYKVFLLPLRCACINSFQSIMNFSAEFCFFSLKLQEKAYWNFGLCKFTLCQECKVQSGMKLALEFSWLMWLLLLSWVFLSPGLCVVNLRLLWENEKFWEHSKNLASYWSI